MTDFIEKISSYNIFNYLLPGIIFSVLTEMLTSYRLIHDDMIITLFISYFVGLCISRVGSLIVEPILIKTGFIKFKSYEEFTETRRADLKLEVLSETNNMYRTICSLLLTLGLLILYEMLSVRIKLHADADFKILCIILFVLFAYSYRKQTRYISKLINKEGKDTD